MKRSSLGSSLVVIGTICAVGAIIYGSLAYANHWWPFEVAASPNDAKVSNDKLLSFKINLRSKKPGDCVLKLTDSSGKEVLKSSRSTKGQKTQDNCENWEVDRSNLAAGEYTANVTFTSPSEREIFKNKLQL